MSDAAKETQKIIDLFAAAVENERLRSNFIELLDELPFCRFEEWAESLTEVAEAISMARDALGEWQDAESREEKADAKESVLEALDAFITIWNDSPIDLSSLTDWIPSE